MHPGLEGKEDHASQVPGRGCVFSFSPPRGAWIWTAISPLPITCLVREWRSGAVVPIAKSCPLHLLLSRLLPSSPLCLTRPGALSYDGE